MNLTSRFTVTMVALVVLTAAAVGVLSYRNTERNLLPTAIEQTDLRFELLTNRLADSVSNVTADIKGFRAAAALAGIVRASLAGGASPGDNVSLDRWRERMALRFVAELSAKPLYSQFRIIGVADGGREIVRVDRRGPDGTTRVVTKAELQRKGDRDYFRETIQLPEGSLYVSAIDLNQENGVIEFPHVPTMRVATPIYTPEGSPFGIVIINVDLRGPFEALRNALKRPALAYIVSAHGDYLVHPDRTREFGFEFGKPARIQDDFSEFDQIANAADPKPTIVADRAGKRTLLIVRPAILAKYARVYAVETMPASHLRASFTPVFRASLYAGLAAVVCAIALAILLARSLTRPLRQMTKAVESFSRGEPYAAPTGAKGEIAVLAHAFDRMSVEVTERTEALRRNTQIFESLSNHVVDPVVLLDRYGKWVYANPAAEALFGERYAIGADAWRELIKTFEPDGTTPIPEERRPINRVLNGENVDNDELLFVLPEGRRAEFIVSGRAIRDDDGTVTGAVMVYHDISAMRETERQLHESQKMDAIGQLTGGVAHDFNNILTIVLGNAELLADKLHENSELATLAKSIATAGTRGAAITHQLLAFARRQPLAPLKTDLNESVGEMVKLLSNTLGEQIEIVQRLDTALWPAMIDPSQLSTALLNLAVNARDAMPDGGKLTIETRNVTLDDTYARQNRDVVPGEYAMLAVSDTGTGIPHELVERVFEPFFTTKGMGKGTGLGLSMVYGFAKQSGGNVKIYSESGLGTTIRLYVPRATTDEASAAVGTDDDAIPTGHESVLVVEDDDGVREHVVMLLKDLGYRVTAVNGGREAMSAAENGTEFDLLFTDVVMPGGMNGRELASELQVRRPGLAVLYTSGYTENAIFHHGRLDAGVALLNKPFRRVDLAQKVRSVLDAPQPAPNGEPRR
jgi:PAS domain S-box-containing protein